MKKVLRLGNVVSLLLTVVLAVGLLVLPAFGQAASRVSDAELKAAVGQGCNPDCVKGYLVCGTTMCHCHEILWHCIADIVSKCENPGRYRYYCEGEGDKEDPCDPYKDTINCGEYYLCLYYECGDGEPPCPPYCTVVGGCLGTGTDCGSFTTCL